MGLFWHHPPSRRPSQSLEHCDDRDSGCHRLPRPCGQGFSGQHLRASFRRRHRQRALCRTNAGSGHRGGGEPLDGLEEQPPHLARHRHPQRAALPDRLRRPLRDHGRRRLIGGYSLRPDRLQAGGAWGGTGGGIGPRHPWRTTP
ncbi:hypothetical protein MTBSS4_290029 [Magnetospirillum sp. SS-4]|nr:hypothetical protein MTBSS4_290029 [Magnetospirillum sp. SS-4]